MPDLVYNSSRALRPPKPPPCTLLEQEVRPISTVIKLGGDFELDTHTYELRRSGRVIKLERIPMEILLLLVEQRGQIVSREQIVEKIWGTGAFLDTDNSINSAIRKIRQVLKDDPEQPRFVQTVTGRGYRFIGRPVEPALNLEASAIAPAVAVPQPETGPSGDNPPTKFLSPTRWPILVGLGAVLITALGFIYFRSSFTGRGSQSPHGRVMLAVLPFENLTGDAGQDYFSDGLTEEMITRLRSLAPQRLGVIARTSVMHYKRSQLPVEAIAEELGVQYLLEGSVRRSSEKVRINAQLLKVSDRTHLWARQYDRELTDILTLQGEIAHQISDEIQLTLVEPDTSSGHFAQTDLSPDEYEAYDLYLKGRYFWNKRTSQDIRQAIEYFEQAIAKRPTDARSYAGLAACYALLSGYDDTVLPMQSMPKARAAAMHALDLNEGLPEAHTALAVIAQNYDWDWQTADKEYRRAIQLNPSYSTAHHWYAESLALQGHFDEAFREMDQARRLDPLSLIIATDNGAILYFSRQYDHSIEQFRAVLDMEPRFPRAHILATVYAQKGMYRESLADINGWARIADGPWNWAMKSYIYGLSGNKTAAGSELERVEEWNRHKEIDPLVFVAPYIGLKNKDKALWWLQKAQLRHSPGLTALKVDPVYDPLRGDPRFVELVHQLRLTE